MPLESSRESPKSAAEQNLQQYEIKDFKEIIGKSADDLRQQVARHNYATLWTYCANCILALWLISNTHLFDYKSSALELSDTTAGVCIILFEFLAFNPRFSMMRWGTPAVALWLLFAPLVFWSPTPAVYLIDTIVACLLITFSILIPGVPGSAELELRGPDQPPYWTYNPSSWIRRWAGIALALVGFFISRYLAAAQLGYIPHAWDPFFGNGSDKVIHSAISRSFPISDAGFGSVAYIMEVLIGFMGDRARWRTAPWIVVMFACLVLPLGVTSIILVITQPIFVGSWCGLCLVAAAALMTSVPLSVHEAVAVGQFLVEAKRQKKSMWQVFWLGGTVLGAGGQDPDRMHYSLLQRGIASVQGVTVPWTIFAQIAIGIWLMARPDLLPASVETANCDHLFGALIVTIAAVSTAEVTRIVRLINVPLGALMIIAALIFARSFPIVLCSEIICGLALIFLSIPRGAIAEKYGSWDRFVK